MSPHVRLNRAMAAASLGVAVLLAGACTGTDQPATDTTGAATGMTTDTARPSGAATTLTDAQIAHIVVTANSIDSAAGEVAKQKGSAKSVKDFAQTMVTDHAAVNKQAVDLATRLNVTPEDNDTSRQLKSGADESAASLQALSGAAFDKAYIDREVAYHQAVLDALDQTLIPGAQNAELKALLEKSRPAFAAHLDRAKSVQSTLGQ